MRISRDEAREIAAVALGLAIVVRILAGVVQVLDELDRGWTYRSLLGRLLAPIGSTVGILTLSLVLLIVLSPPGSVSAQLFRGTRTLALVVLGLGCVSVISSLTSGLGSFINRLWFSMINGCAAVILAGAAWWIISRFESDR